MATRARTRRYLHVGDDDRMTSLNRTERVDLRCGLMEAGIQIISSSSMLCGTTDGSARRFGPPAPRTDGGLSGVPRSLNIAAQ
jgi:hypothetical protein